MQFSIPHSHPALKGHFPDRPIVPAVLILEEVLALAKPLSSARIAGVTQAKFTSVLLPGQTCRITLFPSPQGLRFTCSTGADRIVATGLLMVISDSP